MMAAASSGKHFPRDTPKPMCTWRIFKPISMIRVPLCVLNFGILRIYLFEDIRNKQLEVVSTLYHILICIENQYTACQFVHGASPDFNFANLCIPVCMSYF